MVGWEGSKPAENLIQVVPPVETGLLVVVGAEDTRKPARSRERARLASHANKFQDGLDWIPAAPYDRTA
jgi:hypothetical protein